MRILIADDQSKVRFALRVALERHPGSKSVSEAVDAADLLAQARSVCPDLVLLDWDLPGIAPLDLLRELHRLCPALAVIVLSENNEAQADAIKAGANSFVSKGDSPDHLLQAINECWRKWEIRQKTNRELTQHIDPSGFWKPDGSEN